MKHSSPISELLRKTISEAINEGDTTYLELQRETGITRASIMRFVKGRQFLRLDMADKLAEHFNLELKPKEEK